MPVLEAEPLTGRKEVKRRMNHGLGTAGYPMDLEMYQGHVLQEIDAISEPRQ
jgi:hypothetical protein